MGEKIFIITLSCKDRPGIVANISSKLAQLGANIVSSNQFWDRRSDRFFMRISFAIKDEFNIEKIKKELAPIIAQFDMKLNVYDEAKKSKIIIMVSKFDHVLRHILYQKNVGRLNAHIIAIVSNHKDAKEFAQYEGIDFYHWPIDKNNKKEQEQKLIDLFESNNADLIVLARYMQILSDDLANKYSGKIINIHHSFLPSFKGAKPYHQAYDRGVKIIGATAHYVTSELDEGPIIAQDVTHIDHTYEPSEMIAQGEDIESRVLIRALRLHLEHKIMLNGKKTIIFN